MKVARISLYLIIAAFICISFREEETTDTDNYFIVSFNGGMKKRHHATYYSLSNSDLRVDTSHTSFFIPKKIDELTFNVPMPDSMFAKLKDIPSSIPAELLEHPRFGCGKIRKDGATTYIWAGINGKEYLWQFSSDVSNCSPEIQQFYYKLIQSFR